jgi:hypothetical protein
MKEKQKKAARVSMKATRAVTNTVLAGTGVTGRQAWSQAQKLAATMLAALLVATMLFVSVPRQAQAAEDDWVAAGMPSHLGEIYSKYHTVQDSDMPPQYNDYAINAGNMLYYSKKDNHTIYCIEIDRHTFYQDPDESITPPSKFADDTKQKLLTYLLAKGERFHLPTEESVKNQTATQMAVWLLSDDLHEKTKVLDLICGPETGSQPDEAAFAPTLEVGRMARALLAEAVAFVGGGGDVSTLLGGLPPSFASLTEADATVWPMKAAQGGGYEVDLEDENGGFLTDWSTYLKVVDDAGMQLTADGNTLHISGKPEVGKEYLIKMTGPYSGYKVHYLKSDVTPNIQQMSRFARINDSTIPIYVKVKADEGTEPTDPTEPTEPTEPTTPPSPTKPTPTPPPGKSVLPKTGDTLPLGLLMLLLGGATTAFIVAGLLRKQEKSLKQCIEQPTKHPDSQIM